MPEPATISVLIVEDHQLLRTGLRKSLEHDVRFVVVGEAADGATAVQLARELSPTVILMDIGLPVMDGIEASKQIRASVPNSRLIMLTSCSSDDHVFSALAAGADGYCLKDISEADLFMAISSVVNGAAWLDPQVASRVLQACVSNPPKSDVLKEHKMQFPLSARELEVLQLIVNGFSNIEIGARLFISPDTVKTHIRHIMEKLMVSDRTQAAVKALRQGLIQ